MKKILLSVGVVSALCASEASDKVINFIKEMIPKDLEVKLVKAEKIPNSNYESVEFAILENGVEKSSDIFYTDGNFGAPMLIDLNNKVDLKSEFLAKAEAKKQSKIVEQLPNFLKEYKDITIKLGDKKDKNYTVVFSDPECPWCRKHIEQIEEQLKEENIMFVLFPLPMHKNALSKSINILKEVKKAKKTEDKIAVIKKYFKDDVKYDEPSEKEKEEMSKKVEKAFELGINYTPAIFKDVKIK